MGPRRDEGVLARRKTSGPPLYFYTTLPEGAPRGVVTLVHGYADYGGRYTHVAEAWASQGLATVAVDLRGHGRAGGRRGYCERFSEYVDDVAELTALAQERAAGASQVLFGHSFGGLVAVTAAIADPAPWRALILSAPYFGVAMDLPAAKILGGKLISRLLPTVGLPSGLKGADMTHDAAIARAYDADPLCFKNANSRWFTESLSAQARAQARAPSLKLPLYAAMGTADAVAKYSSAKAFFDAVGSTDKTWNAREGAFHEILNEPNWRPLADAMAAFALAHLG
jgi:alpha-beta hydrolase superfamily lysophospholipase